MEKDKKEGFEKEETIVCTNANNKNRFNFLEVIIIMIITIICTATIVIKVSYSINNTKKKTIADAELLEFRDTYSTIVNEYYGKIDKEKLIESAIEGMMDYLGDPYSSYMSEDETANFNQELDGNYVGIGAQVSVNKDKVVKILEVFDGSPAMLGGLKKDDIIIKVDGNSVDGKTSAEVSNMIKGKENTSVNITVLRDNKTIELKVQRKKIDLKSVTSKYYEKNGKKIGYIDVNVFALNTDKQFFEEMKKLEEKNIEYLIIDLRWNTGGHLSSARNIANAFVDAGKVLYQLDTKGKIQKELSDGNAKYKEKVAILVNKSSASASEILTASLKENIGATVIGETTYGKGKVQKTRKLSSGAMVKYTIQNWLTPNGEEIDQKGIKPTIEVKLSEKYYEEPKIENDNQLAKALSFFEDINKNS